MKTGSKIKSGVGRHWETRQLCLEGPEERKHIEVGPKLVLSPLMYFLILAAGQKRQNKTGAQQFHGAEGTNKKISYRQPEITVTEEPISQKKEPQKSELHVLQEVSVVVVQSLSHVQSYATARTAARQAPLSFTISRSSLKLMSIGSVMPSNYLILCHPLLLLPPIVPSIRVFSKEAIIHIR